MKRIFAAVLVSSLLVTPAVAAPIFVGVQADANSLGFLFGSQIDKTFSVEAHMLWSSSSIDHAGVTVDTKSTSVGFIGMARMPMRLNDVQPYYLFGRAGVEYVSSDETYNIPSSATLTQPYSGNSTSNEFKPTLGFGAEVDLSKSMTGRVGFDFVGKNRTLNVAAVFNF